MRDNVSSMISGEQVFFHKNSFRFRLMYLPEYLVTVLATSVRAKKHLQMNSLT